MFSVFSLVWFGVVCFWHDWASMIHSSIELSKGELSSQVPSDLFGFFMFRSRGEVGVKKRYPNVGFYRGFIGFYRGFIRFYRGLFVAFLVAC